MLRERDIIDIEVGPRHRKDMGDLTSLAESIRLEGLLQPTAATGKLELVFGERRPRATRDILEKATILARIVDVRSILNGEYAENDVRKDVTLRGGSPSPRPSRSRPATIVGSATRRPPFEPPRRSGRDRGSLPGSVRTLDRLAVAW